ncbi:hypothetical protein AAZV13_19G099300 [Glycine max]
MVFCWVFFLSFLVFWGLGSSNGHHLKCGFMGDWDKRQGESNRFNFFYFF